MDQTQMELGGPEVFQVESRTNPGQFYDITVKSPSCTCRGYKLGRRCWHLQAILSLVQGDGGGIRYEVTSAFHKSLRMAATQDALNYGFLLARCRGVSWVKAYLKRIVFEETRSAALLRWFLTEARTQPWYEGIIHFCGARKKWEISAAVGKLSGIKLTEDHRVKFERHTLPPFQSLKDVLYKAKSASDYYSALSLAEVDGRTSIFVPSVLAVLKEIAESHGGIAREIAREFPTASGTDFCQTLIDCLTGLSDVSANEFPHLTETTIQLKPEPVLLRFQNYVFDIHVRSGRTTYEKFFDKLANGQTPPEGMDPRWNGSYTGVCWRYESFRQYGPGYRERKWAAVQQVEQNWQRAWALDSHLVWRGHVRT